MKYLTGVFFLVITCQSILAQQSSFRLNGFEVNYTQRNGSFKPQSYNSYYSSFIYPDELIHPDSLKYDAEPKGHTQKSLLSLSFFRDSIQKKFLDSNAHRFDRLKVGLAVGRNRIRYYSLTIYDEEAENGDSVSHYTVFEDLFRLQTEYLLFTRTHKKLQYYYGLGLYSDFKIGSVLAKDGRRMLVTDAFQKVLVKKYLDLGMSMPLGVRCKLARNTYLHYEFRLGAELATDHMKKTRLLVTRGFNFNLSVAIH